MMAREVERRHFRLPPEVYRLAAELQRKGLTFREIAERLHVPREDVINDLYSQAVEY
jgi:orotate phosphoribosyltransferase-like protein